MQLPSRGGARPHMRAFRPDSAMIERVLFDEEAETLCISFRQSGQYVYEGVPRAVYDGLACAKSAGRFFNESIKGRFPCRPARRRHRPD